jgi:metal-responsive CopG/Arc/MetJ family transcriptional regulator
MNTKFDRISFSLPPSLRDEFESLHTQLNLSRSDAIRKAIQEFIIEESKKRGKSGKFSNKQIIGTITYIEKSHIHAHPPNQEHSHVDKKDSVKLAESGDHSHDTQNRQYYVPREKMEFIEANEIQHSFLDVILSAMHIHPGAEKCMEIIAVKGNYERVLNFTLRYKH